jgi:adenosylhomocysteine nucleosidase
MMDNYTTVVIVSANAEWRAVRELFPDVTVKTTPYGQTFLGRVEDCVYRFFHGGWGKIAAAGSTQYVIDRWQPRLLINLGTCGGFAGEIERGEIVLAEKTVVYDIIEQMGDFDEHIAHYTTELPTGWLKEPYPLPVRRALLVSADRDLLVEQIPELKQRYGAAAGDWESGAIAWVAQRNHTRVLILRGVSDLVCSDGNETYGNLGLFEDSARQIMARLIASLPGWIAAEETQPRTAG